MTTKETRRDEQAAEGSRHTPGPWETHHGVSETGYPCFFIHGLAGDQKRDRVMLDATARLIAAAPDLYEALKAMEETSMRLGLSRGEEGDTAWANALLAHFAALNQARAALAKAAGTGRG